MGNTIFLNAEPKGFGDGVGFWPCYPATWYVWREGLLTYHFSKIGVFMIFRCLMLSKDKLCLLQYTGIQFKYKKPQNSKYWNFLPQYFSGILKLNSSCKFLTVMQSNFAYDAILPQKLTWKSPKLLETEIFQ